MKQREKESIPNAISLEEELAILRKIVDLTSSDLDLTRVLREVVDIVNDLTAADSIFIYLLDVRQRSLVLRASKLPHKRELGKVNLKKGEGITGWVAKQKKAVAIETEAYQDPRFKHFDVLPEDKYEAFLSVPVIHKRRVCGVINVQHRRPYRHADGMVDLISTIAKQVGGVIENARLFEETNLKALQFDRLMKVSQSLTSEDYLDEILNLIVVVTAEMLSSKTCSILLLDDDKGQELIIKATHGLSDEFERRPNLKIEDSLLGGVVKSRRPMTVYDVGKETKYSHRELAAKEGLTSMVAVPMIVRDEVIGVINVYTQEHHYFTEEEVNVLQVVANQAAAAVENTHLMEEAVKAKEALATRKLVEKAKGVLMRLYGLREDQAYQMIHKKSMDTCRSMKEIAESVILVDDFRRG